jgi:hypothetical protein
MKLTKKTIQPAKEVEVGIGFRCDMCGKVYKEKDGYDYCKTKVELDTGTSYGYTGSYEKYSVDLCSDCFSGELVEWLKSKGCKIQFEEDSW